ncbi:hypothetical protein FACS18945_2850 [Bacteroidia bacterium]|nr:hypothetical protein FACS18945_2850 [Bacteroidia bacterium]
MSVLVCYDKNKTDTTEFGDTGFGLIDASAGTQNMLLRATKLGIASCWTHAYAYPKEYRELLNLPENIIPVVLVVLGYSDEPFESRDGFEAEKIHYEKW